MGKINNKDFFKKKIEDSAPLQTVQTVPAEENVCKPDFKREMQLSPIIMEKAKVTATILHNNGLKALANEVVYATKSIAKEHFTVAVVGEFSRGKSTLINRIFDRDILPTGTLPTTALLTRITYSDKEFMTVVSGNGRERKDVPLNLDSWKGLVASNFGEKEPEGHVAIGINDSWLGKYGIDILDTPGAGDLEERRARVIENCLLGADAALIAISATKPFSLTEQTFIRHKILSKGTPFFAIALTQLDLVNESERECVIAHIYKKLKAMKVSMPVLVADDSLKGTCGKYENIVGINVLRELVFSWLTHVERRALTDKWMLTNLNRIVDMALTSLLQQKAILDAKGEEREQLIATRNASLANVHGQWEKLRNEMKYRCDKCIEIFNEKASDCGDTITEALQHEAGRQPNPKEWLDKEYSYRVKRELSAVSLTLDNLVMRQLSTDVRWLNGILAQQFKEVIPVDIEGLAAKEDFVADVNNKGLKIKDIKDVTKKNTMLTTGATLGAAAITMLTGGMGCPVIFATMGVGTIGNILSRRNIDKTIDEQRKQIQDLIAEEMPLIINSASSDSGTKIKILYNQAISEAFAAETRWMQTQRTLIRQSFGKDHEEALASLDKQIKEIKVLKQKL